MNLVLKALIPKNFKFFLNLTRTCFNNFNTSEKSKYSNFNYELNPNNNNEKEANALSTQPINSNKEEQVVLQRLKNQFKTIETLSRNHRYTTLTVNIANIIEFYSSRLTYIIDVEESDSIANIKSKYLELFKIINIFQEFSQYLSLKKQEKEKIKNIISNLITIYEKIPLTEQQNKGIILENLIFFIKKVFVENELNNYILFYKEKAEKFQNDDISDYQKYIHKASTHEIFIHFECFPTKYKDFLKNLKTETKEISKSQTQVLHQNSLNKINILFKKYENISKSQSKELIKDDQSNENQFNLKVLDSLTSLNSYNFLLDFMMKNELNNFASLEEKNEFLKMFQNKLENSLEKMLSQSNIQNIVLFGMLLSNEKITFSDLIRSKYLDFIRKISKNLINLSYLFVSIMQENKFLRTEESFGIFLDYAIEIKSNHFDSMDMLCLVKIFTNFFINSKETNKRIMNLLLSIDKMLFLNYNKILISHKFQLFLLLDRFNIKVKDTMIIKDVLKDVEICPSYLLDKIIIKICDTCYFLTDIENYEKLILERINDFKLESIIQILKQYIFQLKGSKNFIQLMLNDIFTKLDIEKEQKTNRILNDSEYANLYQIIHTILKDYKDKPEFQDPVFLEKKLRDFSNYFKFYQIHLLDINQNNQTKADIEKILQKSGINFEINRKLGIHIVSYILNKTIILDVKPVSNFCSNGNLRGFALWKERDLKQLKEFRYRTITFGQWKKLYSEKEKILFLNKIMK